MSSLVNGRDQHDVHYYNLSLWQVSNFNNKKSRLVSMGCYRFHWRQLLLVLWGVFTLWGQLLSVRTRSYSFQLLIGHLQVGLDNVLLLPLHTPTPTPLFFSFFFLMVILTNLTCMYGLRWHKLTIIWSINWADLLL